jgi:hypothetical protein
MIGNKVILPELGDTIILLINGVRHITSVVNRPSFLQATNNYIGLFTLIKKGNSLEFRIHITEWNSALQQGRITRVGDNVWWLQNNDYGCGDGI